MTFQLKPISFHKGLIWGISQSGDPTTLLDSFIYRNKLYTYNKKQLQYLFHNKCKVNIFSSYRKHQTKKIITVTVFGYVILIGIDFFNLNFSVFSLLYCNVLDCIGLDCIALHRNALHGIVLYCNKLTTLKF